jgi:hypothetical protein
VERPQRRVVREPVLSRQGQQGLGVRLDRLPLPSFDMESSTKAQRLNQTVGMRQCMRHGQRLLTPLHGLVRIAQRPQGPGHQGAEGHPAVQRRPRDVLRARMPLGVVEGDPLLQVGAGRGEGTYVLQDYPQRVVSTQEQGGVVLALSQVEELLRHGLRRLVLCPLVTKRPQSEQYREMLRGLPHLLTQRLGPGEDGFPLGRRTALGDLQRQGKSRQEIQLVLVARGRLGHGGQHLQPRGELLTRFGIRRARHSALPGLVPVGQGLGLEARFRVVPGQQFGLCGCGLGKLRRQHLGNALVILLSGALEERLIRRLLDEGMLERVHGLRRYPPLVEHLGLHQLPQTSPQR